MISFHLAIWKSLFLPFSQVKQLSCDGGTAQVCALGGGAPSILVAALADRLLVLRKSASGATVISPRHLTVLEPLLRGWSSLAAMGILPGEAYRSLPSHRQLIYLQALSNRSRTCYKTSKIAGRRRTVAGSIRDGQARALVRRRKGKRVSVRRSAR